MKIVLSASEIPSGCAFVPTMGALHEGHASLFTLAKSLNEKVAVSIFINPLQFDNPEDLAKYPRTPERDIELAALSGVSYLWLPKYDEIYPSEVKRIDAGPLGKVFEGASRPGHFDGVVTVVRRLFDLVRPTQSIFGEKDFQQLTLIKQVAGDVEIISAPTVREPDGLALSSRNMRLDQESREAALVISRALFAASREKTIDAMQMVLNQHLSSEERFRIDYATIVDEEDFSLATDQTAHKRAIVAGWINGIRLIDNMAMVKR